MSLNMFEIPKPIEEKLTELNKITEEYPENIPIKVAADFLGMGVESLRASISFGGCPFGLAWKQSMKGNRAFSIPTVTFYLWATHGAGFKAGA